MLKTTNCKDFDIYIIRERNSRETTLNEAIQQIGSDDDILFVGDDIQFTPGWIEALQKNWDSAEILGMGMCYPNTERIQDRGYDLVDIDERIVLEPRDRGCNIHSVKPFFVRACDSLCGCFFLVKKEVFKCISRFSEDGMNRWGEFIFMAEARRAGFRTAVIDHYLFHSGHGTKSNLDIKLSSISYQIEKSYWEIIIKKYIKPEWVGIKRDTIINVELLQRLLNYKRILIYGVGTVTEFLVKKLKNNIEYIDFCSGLPEEIGFPFQGKVVLDVKEIDPKKYDWILFTPLNIGEELAFKYFNLSTCHISFVGLRLLDNEREYFCHDLMKKH